MTSRSCAGMCVDSLLGLYLYNVHVGLCGVGMGGCCVGGSCCSLQIERSAVSAAKTNRNRKRFPKCNRDRKAPKSLRLIKQVGVGGVFFQLSNSFPASDQNLKEMRV